MEKDKKIFWIKINMKYKITIDKISPKDVIKETYYPNEKNKKGELGAWADTKITENVSEQIYEQTIDKEIDLKAIIDAFNK